METVEVLIRIPKEDFDFIKDEFADGDMPDEKDLKETTYYAIANGIVLLKGHGRLGDIDFEIKHYESILDNPTPDVNRYDRGNAPVILKALRMIGTVIPADRGDDNG